jgi:hypothetical protein
MFLPPLPTDLITVDCCRACNASFSLDDEAFRIFVSAQETVNSYGRIIFSEKVVGSSFKRSPKLFENVKKAIVRIVDDRTENPTERDALSIPRQRADAFLRRITLGFLSVFHPGLPREDLEFSYSQVEPSSVLDQMAHFSIANGNFRCWRMVMETEPYGGLWIYAFYDGPGFAVTHSKSLGDLDLS